MSFYYCNCRDTRNKVDQGRSKFVSTEVDEEGICTNCGYYAVSTPREAKESVDIYFMTVGYKDVGSEKKNRRKELARIGARKRKKDKESDLDVQ